MRAQDRDHGRVFPARCQAGSEAVILATLVAVSGLGVSNKTPKSPSVVLAVYG